MFMLSLYQCSFFLLFSICDVILSLMEFRPLFWLDKQARTHRRIRRCILYRDATKMSVLRLSSVGQKRVCDDMAVLVLNNAWEGYNATLFAYGQTGSGKSYSVVGYGINKGMTKTIVAYEVSVMCL